MANAKLDKMTTKELKELIASAEAMIAKKEKEERKAALKDARDAVAKWGYSLDDLVGGAAFSISGLTLRAAPLVAEMVEALSSLMMTRKPIGAFTLNCLGPLNQPRKLILIVGA
ncbi:MAG: hypothetical protein WD942_10535 [Dehalococcoidia bacterium]